MRSLLHGTAVILGYHRVAEPAYDTHYLAVAPARFEAHMAALATGFAVLPLDELMARIEQGMPLDRCVSVTFDDGYEDNLLNAKPILEKWGIPATVFVTAGLTDSGREPWWDELERVFLDPHPLPERFSYASEVFSVTLATASRLERQRAGTLLHASILFKPLSVRNAVMDALFAWAGLSRQGRPLSRLMSAAQCRALAAGGLIRIGGHTLDHAWLPAETRPEQFRQVVDSCIRLEDILGQPVTTFAYPYGAYDQHSVEAAMDCGARGAVTVDRGRVRSYSHLYQLPRLLVRDVDVNAFHDLLDEALAPTLPAVSREAAARSLRAHVGESLATTLKRPPGDAGRLSVLAVNTTDVGGGAAMVAGALADALRGHGARCCMLVGYCNGRDNPEDVQLLVKSRRPEDLDLAHFARREGWLDMFQAASLAIVDHPWFAQSHVVHLHNLHGDYFSPLALPRLARRRPVVWTLHDMQALTGHCAHSGKCAAWETGCGSCPDLAIYPGVPVDATHLVWDTRRVLYDACRMTVVCPSLWIKKLVERSVLSRQDVRHIPNGVDIEVFRPGDARSARAELGIPDKAVVVLFVAHGGINNVWKGGNILRAAFEAFAGRADIHFLVLGGQSQDFGPNWTTIPHVDNPTSVARYYRCADIFFYPTQADNAPLVVLEAMATGLPVLASAVGGAPDQVEQGVTGLLAAPDDQDGFLRNLARLADDPELRAKLGHAGMERARMRFSLRGMTEAYFALYEELREGRQ